MNRQNANDWTEVRRRRTINNGEITTFFVSKIPQGVRKEEIRSAFSRQGRITDVYMANKKDSGGNNFAFIRFTDVNNAKEMENALNGVTIRGTTLAVNVARYQRDGVQRKPEVRSHQTELPARNVQNVRPAYKDRRSFAEVTAGVKNSPGETPIPLKTETSLKQWAGNLVLIGEAFSLNHLSTFHEYLKTGMTTKYLGVLTLALQFGSSICARDFLEDVQGWKDWFRWLRFCDQRAIQYERVAWLKIVGVPIPLWDEENFSCIAGKFGKVVNPFDYINNRSDWSMDKVGVLTSRRSWINEELNVLADGEVFRIGIVEYTDDWSPFKPLSFDKMVESDDDDDDSEGVSDTWLNEEDEPEEGEFIPGCNNPIDEDGGKCDRTDDAQHHDKEPMDDSPVTGKSTFPDNRNCVSPGGMSSGNDQSVHVELNVGGNESSPGRNGIINENNNWKRHVGKERSERDNGPVVNLVSLGCFGPFPSVGQLNGVGDGLKKRLHERKIKRRRADSGGKSCSPISGTDSPICDHVGTESIDLNSNPRPCQSGLGDLNIDDTQGNLEDEIEATVRVGTELGFQIFKEDVVRLQENEVDGDTNVAQ
ncbi:hypothetical protein L1887_35573 [Cichorium endivia]|nr:hypothetical protein L1887_35573 [Cichorium endivia]